MESSLKVKFTRGLTLTWKNKPPRAVVKALKKPAKIANKLVAAATAARFSAAVKLGDVKFNRIQPLF